MVHRYIENLPAEIRADAVAMVDKVRQVYDEVNAPPEVKQYMVPMGFLVPVRITGDLKGLTYFVELWLYIFVHPTLVEIASHIAQELQSRLARWGYKLHIDPTPHRFDVRRGLQTILLKLGA